PGLDARLAQRAGRHQRRARAGPADARAPSDPGRRPACAPVAPRGPDRRARRPASCPASGNPYDRTASGRRAAAPIRVQLRPERTMKSAYDIDLDRNAATYTPLSPLSFLRKAAEVYPEHLATVHGERRLTWREVYTRCRRLASALAA